MTAKLFSANTSLSAPSVLVPSLRSQRSNWSLKGSPIPIPVAIATGSQAAHRVPRTANQRSESLPRTRNRRLPSTVPVRGGRCHVPVVSKEQRAEAPRRLFAAGFYGDRSAGARMRVDTRSLIVGV